VGLPSTIWSPQYVVVLYAIPLGACAVSLLSILTASQPRIGRWLSQLTAPFIEKVTAPATRLFARLTARPVRAAGR
jgi:hypothetical protein